MSSNRGKWSKISSHRAKQFTSSVKFYNSVEAASIIVRYRVEFLNTERGALIPGLKVENKQKYFPIHFSCTVASVIVPPRALAQVFCNGAALCQLIVCPVGAGWCGGGGGTRGLHCVAMFYLQSTQSELY